jgi:hypothetical protein
VRRQIGQLAELQHHAFGDVPLEFMWQLAAPVVGTPSWSQGARASNRFAVANLRSWLPGMGRKRKLHYMLHPSGLSPLPTFRSCSLTALVNARHKAL